MSKDNILTTVDSVSAPIVVIGAGPVGIDFCKKMAAKSNLPIVVYADENYFPYNRVKLSLYLAGEISHDELFFDLSEEPVFQSGKINLKLGEHIANIDRDQQLVVNQFGETQPYSRLIMATGAASFTPPIKGIDSQGVYTFRDLKDADHLLARLSSSRNIVIVGGGLLGLEIAKGLARHGTKVQVIDVNAWVLFRQLNQVAAEKVSDYFTSLGIEVITDTLVKEIVSNEFGRMTGFYSTQSNDLVSCDTMIFATGTKPNTRLASEAGLAYAKGIIVNQFLQTSDNSIYAIGDCAEYESQSLGIVSPGYDQASVAVNHLLDLPGEYHGSEFTTVLKVAGIEVFCAGSQESLLRGGVKTYEYTDKDTENYRCIITDNNRVVYVIGIGEWSEANRLAEAVSSERRFSLLRFILFTKIGHFFPDQESSVAYWPENAIVCNCMSVNRGSLSNAIIDGCCSIDDIQKTTQASTVCGSCQPKIQDLLEQETGGKQQRVAMPYSKIMFLTGFITFISVLSGWLLPAIPASDTSLSGAYDQVWLDGLYKQITGFTLLGLSLLAMSLSISKRYVEKFKKSFGGMRSVHTVIGLLTVAVLLLHTGNNMGDGLNQLLFIDFVVVLSIGALMALWLSFEHKTAIFWANKFRKFFGWGHILAVWALPVLLTFHIISVYYF